MFENLGWAEIMCLVLLALFIFGPERLPKIAADAARFLRRARAMARNAAEGLREQTGMEVDDIADLHPKRFVRRHLLTEEEQESLRSPVHSVFREMEEEIAQLKREARGHRELSGDKSGERASALEGLPSWSALADEEPKQLPGRVEQQRDDASAPPRIDPDAT